MTAKLTPSLLQTMADWVDLHIGLKISEARLAEFEKGICLAAADSGFEEPQDYVTTLIRSAPDEREIGFLSSYLTVGETYFFRDPLSFSVLSSHILPSLERSTSSRLKIWSAGCASGEEPYSLAMTVMSYFGSRAAETVEVLGTDINPRHLERARGGVYRRWSFRDVPAFIRDTHFKLGSDDRYRLNDRVKRLVRFFSLNLASDRFPSLADGTDAVDVIFCRNVLIYFSPQQVAQVLRRFHRCLKPGGYLFLAPTEIPHPSPDIFSIVNIDGAIVLRKEVAAPGIAGATDSESTLDVPVSIVQSNYSYFGVGAGVGFGSGPGASSGESFQFKSFETLVDSSELHLGGRPESADRLAGESQSFQPGEGGPSSPLLSGLELDAGVSSSGIESLVERLARLSDSVSDAHMASLPGLAGGRSPSRLSERDDHLGELLDAYEYAERLFDEGKYSDAVDILLDSLTSYDEHSADSMLLLARSYANCGDLEAAQDWMERLIAAEPVNPRWYYLRATILQEEGKETEAVSSLRQAIFLDQDFVLAHFALANIHRHTGRRDESRRSFETSLRLLSGRPADEILTDSDGLMVSQLSGIIKSLL